TLLNLLATIDRPTSGTVAIEGTDVSQLRGEQLALFRRRRLGFVFQDYNLLDSLTLGENIALPLVLDRVPVRIIKERLRMLAGQLGIGDILHKYPYEVSGGQQQRAAAARAIIHEPAVILADEPTGNLDSRSAKDLMETLVMLNNMAGVTIVMVTHDAFAASYCRRIQFIRDGQIYTEIRRGDSREAFFQQILDVLALMGGGRDEPLANRG
ncbi:MAG: bacitracin ABC transporter ATP-binding protein, partial [Symbiobacterium thermophilum]